MAYAEGAAISSLHCPGVRKPVQLYGVPFEKITQTKAKTPHDMGGHQAASWIFGQLYGCWPPCSRGNGLD